MARFSLNRRWTFILALGVFLVLSSLIHSSSSADAVFNRTGDPGDGVGGGTNGVGDPDVPIGPTKGANSGVLTRGSTSLGTRTAGDARFARSASVWRLRVVLQGLRSFYLRF